METTISSTASGILNEGLAINWILILEFLKVLAWPFIATGSIFYFRKSIATLINKAIGIKIPGGLEISARDQSAVKEKSEQAVEKQIAKLSGLLKTTREEYEKSLSKAKKDAEFFLKEISVKNIQIDFERIYNLIFGTQLLLLRRLNPKGEIGEKKDEMVRFFVMVQRAWPALQNWSFDQYLGFLLESGLIEPMRDDGYRITDKGRAFLSYITSLGYLENKAL